MNCPRCGTEWLADELDSIGDIGCSGCRRTFDLEDLESDERKLFDVGEVADIFLRNVKDNS